MTNPTFPDLPPMPKPTWTPLNRTAGFAWSEDDMRAYVEARTAHLMHRVAEMREALNTLIAATERISIGQYDEEAHDIAVSLAREALGTASTAAHGDVHV